MFELEKQPTWFIKIRLWICNQITAVMIVSLILTMITTPIYAKNTVTKLMSKVKKTEGKDMNALTFKDWIVVIITALSVWWCIRTLIGLYNKFNGKVSSLDKYLEQRNVLMDELMKRGAYGPTQTSEGSGTSFFSKINPVNWFRKK